MAEPAVSLIYLPANESPCCWGGQPSLQITFIRDNVIWASLSSPAVRKKTSWYFSVQQCLRLLMLTGDGELASHEKMLVKRGQYSICPNTKPLTSSRSYRSRGQCLGPVAGRDCNDTVTCLTCSVTLWKAAERSYESH